MTTGIVIVFLLAAGVLAFVIAPLLRSDAAVAELRTDTTGKRRDLQARHAMVLSSLKDLEEDRATGKLDDADYEDLRSRLTSQAVELLRDLDDADPERPAEPVTTERRA